MRPQGSREIPRLTTCPIRVETVCRPCQENTKQITSVTKSDVGQVCILNDGGQHCLAQESFTPHGLRDSRCDRATL